MALRLLCLESEKRTELTARDARRLPARLSPTLGHVTVPLTHTQPAAGQAHRCCPHRSPARSGPGEQDSFEKGPTTLFPGPCLRRQACPPKFLPYLVLYPTLALVV